MFKKKNDWSIPEVTEMDKRILKAKKYFKENKFSDNEVSEVISLTPSVNINVINIFNKILEYRKEIDNSRREVTIGGIDKELTNLHESRIERYEGLIMRSYELITSIENNSTQFEFHQNMANRDFYLRLLTFIVSLWVVVSTILQVITPMFTTSLEEMKIQKWRCENYKVDCHKLPKLKK